MHGPWPIDGSIGVPTGYCEFRARSCGLRALRRRVFTDIRRWTAMDRQPLRGLEQPQALAHEIRSSSGTSADGPVSHTNTMDIDPNVTANLLRATRRVRPSTPIPRRPAEWLDALSPVVRVAGHERALALLRLVEEQAQGAGIVANVPPYSAYRNTIPVRAGRPTPATSRSRSASRRSCAGTRSRWSCAPGMAYGELGGHIGSYASAAEIFETGFNHFFRADDGRAATSCSSSPIPAPGVYARAFLEGGSDAARATTGQEVGGNGLSSYPHPWLMPEFWQSPTGSMGLGPISAIYQARFMRYLSSRGLVGVAPPRGACSATARWTSRVDRRADARGARGLDNLTFVINCNLQRLDGPVRGNGRSSRSSKRSSRGAGWNVIKVLWGSDWDRSSRATGRISAAARVRRDASTGSTRRWAPTTATTTATTSGLDPELQAWSRQMSERRSTPHARRPRLPQAAPRRSRPRCIAASHRHPRQDQEGLMAWARRVSRA